MNSTTSDYVFSLEATITIGLLSSLMAILTTGGNLLVLVAFATDSTIRTFSDLFILNLAVADFIIGCICIPPYIPYMLTGVWSGGRIFCKLWLVLDYIAPATSTMAVCVISIDRYMQVAWALNYKSRQTRNLMLAMMLSPWIITFFVFCPAIIFWEMVSGVDDLPESVCLVPYYNNLPFLLFGGGVEFIVPLTVIIIVNLLLFFSVRKRSKVGIRGQLKPTEISAISDSRPIGTSEHASAQPNRNNIVAAAKSNQHSIDRQVAKSLFILVFIFIMCWMPYEIMALIVGISPGAIHPVLFEVGFWILWFNSTLNPILYPLLHLRIRKAFRKLLKKMWCAN